MGTLTFLEITVFPHHLPRTFLFTKHVLTIWCFSIVTNGTAFRTIAKHHLKTKEGARKKHQHQLISSLCFIGAQVFRRLMWIFPILLLEY